MDIKKDVQEFFVMEYISKSFKAICISEYLGYIMKKDNGINTARKRKTDSSIFNALFKYIFILRIVSGE